MSVPGKVRIIGGKWRGRKIKVVATSQLRPTLDRVRETLFNWLRPKIVGANCLDCFAGTGILGLEALSQGAGSVTFIEQDARLVKNLSLTLSELNGVNDAKVVNQDVLAWLKKQQFAQPFNVIFLDPPYGKDLLAALLSALKQAGAIDAKTYIYYEDKQPLTTCGESFSIIKQAKAGLAHFHLIQWSA